MWRIFGTGLIVLITLSACGGGGGGDGAGGGDNNVPSGRTRGTGVRLIHAALYASPSSIKVAGKLSPVVHFAEPSAYRSIAKGAQLIEFERAVVGGVLAQPVALEVADKQEYSVLLYNDQTLTPRALTIEDAIVAPEKGKGLVRVINAIRASGSLNFQMATYRFANVGFAEASEIQTLPVGSYAVTITDAAGTLIGESNFNLPDQGEVCLVLAGDLAVNTRILTVYTDFD